MAGRWIQTVLSQDVAVGADSGTITVDNISRSNFIGSMWLSFVDTNGATSNLTECIEETTTKIEVIGNGSVVIKSYDGTMCRKLAQMHSKKIPFRDRTSHTSLVQEALFPIEFGRFPDDEMCLLPAKLFSTLQLKFTWAGTDAATEWDDPAANRKYTIMMREYVSNDDPYSKLILKDSEIESFTTVASGNKDIKIPLGNRIRKFLIYCYEAAVADGTDITNFELRLNGGASVPISGRWKEQQYINAYQYGGLDSSEGFETYVGAAAATDIATRNSKLRAVLVNSGAETDDVVGIDATTRTTDTVSFDSEGAAAGFSSMYIDSPVLANCIILDFDLKGDLVGCLPTAGLQDLTLRLTNAAAGGTCKILAQEVLNPKMMGL